MECEVMKANVSQGEPPYQHNTSHLGCWEDLANHSSPQGHITHNDSSLWGADQDDMEAAAAAGLWTASGAELQARAALLWCIPPIVVLGTVGNALCVLVLQRKAMQTTPSSTYLMSLAAADTLFLYTSAVKTWVRVVADFELLHVADAVCRLTKYVFFTSTHVCAWLVVLLSLERFLVVSLPFHATGTALVRRPGLVTLGVVLAIMAINTNVLWSSQLVVVAGGAPRCLHYPQHSWMCRVVPVLNLLLYSALPSLLILVLNVAIIALVLRSVHSVHQARLLSETSSCTKSGPALTLHQATPLCSSGPASSAPVRASPTLSSKTQRRLTATLSTICVSWLLLTTPYCLMENVPALRGNVLVRAACFLLLYLNHALNFYIYCLTGKKFRHELQRAFGCRHARPHPSKQPRPTPGKQGKGQEVKVRGALLAKDAGRDLHGKVGSKETPQAHLYN